MAYPDPVDDERELFMRWLDFLRRSLISKLDGLSEEQARWNPAAKLLSVLGVVNPPDPRRMAMDRRRVHRTTDEPE